MTGQHRKRLDNHRQDLNLDLEEGNRMYCFLILVALVRKPWSRNHGVRTEVLERMRERIKVYNLRSDGKSNPNKSEQDGQQGPNSVNSSSAEVRQPAS